MLKREQRDCWSQDFSPLTDEFSKSLQHAIQQSKQQQKVHLSLQRFVVYEPQKPLNTIRFIIFKGLFALHPIIRHNWDLCVAIHGGLPLGFVSTVYKSIHQVGQVPQEVIRTITDAIYPLNRLVINPTLQVAQVKILNYLNSTSGLVNPLFKLKLCNLRITVNHVEQLLAQFAEEHHARLRKVQRSWYGTWF